MVLGLPCALCQLPHLVLAASLILSAVKPFRFHAHALVLFHALLGSILLLYPQLLYRPMIAGGDFDDVHVILQRFTAPFHLGFAFFHARSTFLDKTIGINAAILFAKAMVAALMLLNNLTSAYLLYEQRARGQHVSQNFLSCSLMLDGIWLAVELYKLIYWARSSLTDEIELMCARTRRHIQTGHTQFGAQRVLFWADAAIGFFCALFQFAFAEQLLKVMIRREHVILGLHEMYAREYACQCLGIAIISLVASFQLSISDQLCYIGQRILAQVLVCALNAWAHFGVGVFAPAHIVPFVLAFFHGALLFMLALRVHAEHKQELLEAGAPALNAEGKLTPTTYVFRTTTTSSNQKNK